MPGLIYGAGDTSSVRANIIQYLQRKLPILPTQTAMCWAHVDDVAKGHLLAMEKGKTGKSYHVAGESYKLLDAFLLAQEITGIPAPRAIPSQILKVMSVLVKPVDAVLPENYTSDGLRIIAGTTYLSDNSKARRELGFDPRPLRQGLEQALRHEMTLLDMK